MTHDVWLIADLHLGHEACCTKFKRANGSPLRPFASANEMDHTIIERWNARVKEFDRVYVLGDVAISRRNLKTLVQLPGKKRLVKGNHDIFKLKDYLPYFEEIHGCAVRDGLIMTHVPIHPTSIGRFGANVHGHLHDKQVMWDDLPDPRYCCVSVEQTDYAPLHIDEVRQRIKDAL